MAAQAAAVLRDKRKRWENQFLHFIQFSAKHGWYLTHLFYVHNPNLAWQVREGSLKRRGRTKPQSRSVQNKSQNVKFSLCLWLFQLLQTSLSVRCFFTSFPFSLICIDPLQKHVTFLIGGNLMGIASKWKISNCLTVISRLHISLQRQMDPFSSWCRNILLQFHISTLLCLISN